MNIVMEIESPEAGGSVKYQYIASMLMSLTAFSYGSTVGWLSPSLSTLTSDSSPLGNPLSEKDISLLASLLYAGSMVGTPMFGFITDKFGRKIAGLVCAIPFVISFILQLTAKSVSPMFVARFISGIGGAGAPLVSLLYASEVASSNCRGQLGAIVVLAINAGILFSYIVGSYVDYYAFIWILLIIPLLFLISFCKMPETPSFLVKKGKFDIAVKSIAWLRNVPEDSRIVRQILQRLQHDQKLADQSIEKIASLKEILFSAITIKAFSICLIMITIQGCIGMFAIMSYASLIFGEAGGDLSPNTSAIILATLQIFGSYLSTILIERLGRKLLFISSAAVVSMGMATLGTYFYYKENKYDVSNFGWVPLVALSLAVMMFSVGVGPVPFVITSEVFMVQVRGIATTTIVLWLWVTAFIVSQFYSSAVGWLGTYGTFWGFAIIAATGVIFTVLFVPETKGKPLDEIFNDLTNEDGFRIPRKSILKPLENSTLI